MDAGLHRQWVIRSEAEARALHTFLKLNARAAAEAGRPLQVTVAVYRENRSNEQNAFMWAAVLEPIARQVYVGGQRFTAEVWNEHLKEQLLPDVNAKGMQKWMHLPNGQRRLMMSTRDLNVDEMRDYLDRAAAFAATELGVVFDAPPVDPTAGRSRRLPPATGTTTRAPA